MKKIVDDERLMIKICDMHYNQNMSQKAIATALELSRPTISRIIANAREKGIVTITIKNLDAGNYVDLEHKIETIYNLKEVIVADHKDSPAEQKKALGEVTSKYLTRVIHDRNIVGVSMGTTLRAVVNQVQADGGGDAKDVFFVPMIGGMGNLNAELHSNSLVQDLAKAYDGKFIPMFAPARVANRMIRREFLSEASIAKVTQMCDNLDVALVGIGYPSRNSAIMATGYYTREEMRHMKEDRHVTGDICMQFYDTSGSTEPYHKENTVIGMEIKKLRKVPHSIGVAAGELKLPAIKGAINGRYINTLITDANTAKLLAENN